MRASSAGLGPVGEVGVRAWLRRLPKMPTSIVAFWPLVVLIHGTGFSFGMTVFWTLKEGPTLLRSTLVLVIASSWLRASPLWLLWGLGGGASLWRPIWARRRVETKRA